MNTLKEKKLDFYKDINPKILLDESGFILYYLDSILAIPAQTVAEVIDAEKLIKKYFKNNENFKYGFIVIKSKTNLTASKRLDYHSLKLEKIFVRVGEDDDLHKSTIKLMHKQFNQQEI